MQHKFGQKFTSGGILGPSATRYSLNDAGMAQFYAQAKIEAPGRFEKTRREWDNNYLKYPEWLSTQDKCPHCRKHQLWSSYYYTFSIFKAIIFLGICFFAVYLLSSFLFGGEYLRDRYGLQKDFLLYPFLFLFVVSSSLFALTFKIKLKKRKIEYMELKPKENETNYPHFVEWGKERIKEVDTA